MIQNTNKEDERHTKQMKLAWVDSQNREQPIHLTKQSSLKYLPQNTLQHKHSLIKPVKMDDFYGKIQSYDKPNSENKPKTQCAKILVEKSSPINAI